MTNFSGWHPQTAFNWELCSQTPGGARKEREERKGMRKNRGKARERRKKERSRGDRNGRMGELPPATKGWSEPWCHQKSIAYINVQTCCAYFQRRPGSIHWTFVCTVRISTGTTERQECLKHRFNNHGQLAGKYPYTATTNCEHTMGNDKSLTNDA